MSLSEKLEEKWHTYKNPSRIALSRKYPFLKTPIILVRKTLKKISNSKNAIARKKTEKFFPSILVRHQSVLRRKLGDSDMRLQEQKIINLQNAAKKLDGLIIFPKEIFSFWEIVGSPSYKNGYVDGMLLSNGKVVEGVGGGLCQMANLLCWMFLHLPISIKERHHHSLDVFPDSGRVIPFGSGATIMHNFIDFQIQNTLSVPIQLHIWVEEKHLKGRILSVSSADAKWHVVEKNHTFFCKENEWFRYNEIWQEKRMHGKKISEHKVFENFAPVIYSITPEYLQENNFSVVVSEQN